MVYFRVPVDFHGHQLLGLMVQGRHYLSERAFAQQLNNLEPVIQVAVWRYYQVALVIILNPQRTVVVN